MKLDVHIYGPSEAEVRRSAQKMGVRITHVSEVNTVEPGPSGEVTNKTMGKGFYILRDNR